MLTNFPRPQQLANQHLGAPALGGQEVTPFAVLEVLAEGFEPTAKLLCSIYILLAFKLAAQGRATSPLLHETEDSPPDPVIALARGSVI